MFLLSIILLLITFFVHSNTYEITVLRHEGNFEKYKIKAPLWLVILVVIGLLTPYINVIVFSVGAFLWVMNIIIEKSIVFYNTSKLYKKIINFLNKKI